MLSIDLLKPFNDSTGIQYLFLHMITNFTGFSMDDYFEKLCKTFPQKTIVAAGQAVFGVQRQFTNLIILKKDETILQFIKTKNASKPF